MPAKNRPAATPRSAKARAACSCPKRSSACRFRERFYDPLFDGGATPSTRSPASPGRCTASLARVLALAQPAMGSRSEDAALGAMAADARCHPRGTATARRGRITLSRSADLRRRRATIRRARARCRRRIACARPRAASCRAQRVRGGFLDLSRLTAEYGRVIYPCKACVSTAMPLCHWPCSCYPNHARARCRTGWPRSIRAGSRRTAS